MATVLQFPFSSEKSAASSPQTRPRAHERYVLYDENHADAFDVQPRELQVEGPSPYAFDESTSVPEYTPKKASGVLDETYKYTEETPYIGRTYHDIDLRDVIENEELLRDLAITISERGVVFFKNQHNLTIAEQKKFTDKLGLAAGKPKVNGLHIHPTALAGGLLTSEDKIDPEVFLVSSRLFGKLYDRDDHTRPYHKRVVRSDNLESNWHSDITFEPSPADFSCMRLIESPSGNPTEAELSKRGGGPTGGPGGDTLWASGYALAERLSPSFLAFLETLTGEYSQPNFHAATSKKKVPFYTAPRGAKENVGDELIAYHPVVRTNPTTGWKSVFAIGEHFRGFVGLSPSESQLIKDYLLRVLQSSPEIQVRHKWDDGDIAVWDNRNTYHSAIYDLLTDKNAVRTGVRSMSVGERPFFDPKSKLRYEALGL